MKCPNCLENFHETWSETSLSYDKEKYWHVRVCTCPACKKMIIEIGSKRIGEASPMTYRLVQPKAISRMPLPSEVNDSVVIADYQESCLVLADSPKASAALSRRTLQHILREKAGVKKADLAVEIDEVIASNKLPSDLADNLDAVRNVGAFAAHPIKSKSSGEVVDVEPGEAEWNLDVVEELIDFYFVRPARNLKKKTQLNVKLKDAGKPELA